METRSWTTMDKTVWGPGPWADEPDKLQWIDDATRLPCLIRRSRMGVLCGYVGVTEGHPWYRRDYSDVEPRPEVHGGLTYAAHCQDGDEAQTICHVPEPGEPDDVWWVGFDCAHCGDLVPSTARTAAPYDAYRTINYVRNECASLAEQALAAGS